MATKLGKQISRAVANAIQARDRVEMRAMNAVLSLVEAPRGKSRPKPSKQRAQSRGATRRGGVVRRQRRSR